MSVSAARIRRTGKRVIEIKDSNPAVEVELVEYIRLLGYPRGWVLKDRAKELADAARDWYSAHGRPWVYAREAGDLQLGDDAIVVDGVSFRSGRVRNTLHSAGAHSAILAAASAGPELEEEAQARWQDGKPDEYFFLEVYGSAVVEHLVTMTGARLCAWADGQSVAVLPHYSPGYPDWNIDQQALLLDLIGRRYDGPFPLQVFESGMLQPKKSLLALFGLTRHTDRVRRLTDLNPCDNCSFIACQFRRAPYRRAKRASSPELPVAAEDAAVEGDPLDRNATYSVSVKALQRWSGERLTLVTKDDGTVDADFTYEGTTCTNMGRPLKFHYHVTLGSREDGYPIRKQWCRPAPGDEGHTSMCQYIRDREPLMAAIDRERPLHGQPLDDVVRWSRPSSPAGCYCEADSRQHKWGLVLETIHYALARQQADPGSPATQHQDAGERARE
jgi:hypothetical protein